MRFFKAVGHGRGTNYHIYGANVALKGADVTLEEANVTLEAHNVTLNKRYSKEQLKDMVVKACDDWATAEQIADYIGRKVRYVKSHVLPLMEDTLEKMYDVPHHPRQKYRSRK